MSRLSLFNVNGSIGRGAYADPDFADVAEFTDHLDYLGIARSLVWHVAARDIQPTYGNRQLLSELDRAGVTDRLLPAFVVTPACFYEKGTLDFLRNQLGTGKVHALRLMPVSMRFPIRQMERLLAELAEFSPLVLWDCRSEFDHEQNMRDFEALAARFTGMTFAAVGKMWPGFGSVIDLMWRCPNVVTDISWLHMRDTIELLTDQFGAERVLFGVGFKSHYGAAIASLSHAGLSDAQRLAIAHGNAERLLNLPPYTGSEPAPPALLSEKPLWLRNRAGQPLRDVEIVDAHAHTPPHTRGWYMRRNRIDDGLRDVIDRMDRLGIDRIIESFEAALFGENLFNNRKAEQILEAYRDRVSGYLVFNPRYASEMTPALDDFFSRGFYVGFKLLCGYWKIPLTDPGFEPVWEYAHRKRLPVLMHTWDDAWNSPAMLTEIVKRYPDAFYLLGHSGGGTRGRLEAEALALEHPTVFLEFCGSFTTPRPFETSLQIVGPDRVLFGSDASAHDPAWELGRYLSMPLPDEMLIPGLAANIKRILAARRP